MAGHYGTVTEVIKELEKRGYGGDKDLVVQAMKQSGLFCPLGDQDLAELAQDLGVAKSDAASHLVRTKKILASQKWQQEVSQLRVNLLNMPKEGCSCEEARALHDALLDSLAGHPKDIKIGLTKKSVIEYWGDVIRETRQLCSMFLAVDPGPLDRLRENFATGRGDFLIGLRKLLDPDGCFRLGGKEVQIRPSPTDRLLAYILWGFELSAEELMPGPTMSYTWERLADGGGRLFEHSFDIHRATPSEARELKETLRKNMENFYENALLNLQKDKTWKERWENWNRVFPDRHIPSEGAMRKRVEYLRKNR